MRHFTRAAFAPQRVELVLTAQDGAPWRLEMTRGCERFIGLYPRVAGIAGGAPLLAYRAIAPAG